MSTLPFFLCHIMMSLTVFKNFEHALQQLTVFLQNIPFVCARQAGWTAGFRQNIAGTVVYLRIVLACERLMCEDGAVYERSEHLRVEKGEQKRQTTFRLIGEKWRLWRKKARFAANALCFQGLESDLPVKKLDSSWVFLNGHRPKWFWNDRKNGVISVRKVIVWRETTKGFHQKFTSGQNVVNWGYCDVAGHSHHTKLCHWIAVSWSSAKISLGFVEVQ